MSKIGIVGNGFRNTRLLVAEAKGNKITEELLIELATKTKCSVDQIEVVPEEDFATRYKELGQIYTITPRPDITPMPDIYIEDSLFGGNKRKLRTYTESDVISYNKKITKRRKRNKNKKTHRK